MKKLILAGSLAGLLSCTSCVARGARVRVPKGTRPIEELKLGDEVICVDPRSGEQATAILSAVRTAHRECVRLTIGATELTLTSDHPVYCPVTDAWTPAGDWALGNKTQLLEVLADGTRSVTVTKASTFAGLHDVFDLSVDHPLHNFVANGILVHNKKYPQLPCQLSDGGSAARFSECTCATAGVGELECNSDGTGTVCAGCVAEASDGGRDGG